jgi:hypothetical protein
MTESQNYISLVSNLVGLVRNEILEGRPYLAVPMVMMKEGVLNGSDGPLLYTSEELAKFPRLGTRNLVLSNTLRLMESLSLPAILMFWKSIVWDDYEYFLGWTKAEGRGMA